MTVAVLAYPGVQRAALEGVRDILQTAEALRPSVDPNAPTLRVESVDDRSTGTFTAVVVPPRLGADAPESTPSEVRRWLETQHAQGAILCGVCAGSFLLGDAGLLDGRRAATHQAFATVFDARFPQAIRIPAQDLIEDGRVVTSGGLMSWSAVACLLVERCCGDTLAEATRKTLAGDCALQEHPRHADDDILKVQRWIAAHRTEALTTARLARVAAMGERTLLRRFRQATGQTPARYLEDLRLLDAQRLLRRTKRSVDEIATLVGYGDGRTLRRIFQRRMGCSPSSFRRGAELA
ncbi:MAG: helix-turn-helix domain-containing protein [Myxococcota bacterium]